MKLGQALYSIFLNHYACIPRHIFVYLFVFDLKQKLGHFYLSMSSYELNMMQLFTFTSIISVVRNALSYSGQIVVGRAIISIM